MSSPIDGWSCASDAAQQARRRARRRARLRRAGASPRRATSGAPLSKRRREQRAARPRRRRRAVERRSSPSDADEPDQRRGAACAPRDAATIIASVSAAIHSEAPPPTATARALDAEQLRSARWRPMPADTVTISRSTSELVGASTRGPRGRAAEQRDRRGAHQRERDVAEDEARERARRRSCFARCAGPRRSRRSSDSATSVGASSRTRADFDAAAMTPPAPPIWLPTATALERSLTASPLHSPANAGVEPERARRSAGTRAARRR